MELLYIFKQKCIYIHIYWVCIFIAAKFCNLSKPECCRWYNITALFCFFRLYSSEEALLAIWLSLLGSVHCSRLPMFSIRPCLFITGLWMFFIHYRPFGLVFCKYLLLYGLSLLTIYYF